MEGADFARVYAETFDFVWRLLVRFGVPAPDLPDAAQEVYLVVHRRLADFEGRSKLTTWLFRICFRVSRSRARRAYLRREVLDDDEAERMPSDAPTAEQTVQQQRDLAKLQAILDAMDFDCRVVFCLFELEDLTGAQIAETLELPLGTVYSRLRKARAIVDRHMHRGRAAALSRLPALEEGR